MIKEKFIGNLNIDDKLTLAPHRLLALGKNKLVIIAENSGGWCISNSDDYLYLKNLFAQREIIFNEQLDNQTSDILKLLWDSDSDSKKWLLFKPTNPSICSDSFSTKNYWRLQFKLRLLLRL